MSLRRIWLILSGLLFFAWIGWLAFLAATTTRPIILSRAQFLVSTLDVIARIDLVEGKPSDEVKILEVHFPQSQKSLEGRTIKVLKLPDAPGKGWKGPGTYILALEKDGPDYRVAPIPSSPGFDPLNHQNDFRIYALTPETRRQLESIHKDLLPETVP